MIDRTGWRGAPRDPPRTAPHIVTDVCGGGDRVRFTVDGGEWIEADTVVSLQDQR